MPPGFRARKKENAGHQAETGDSRAQLAAGIEPRHGHWLASRRRNT